MVKYLKFFHSKGYLYVDDVSAYRNNTVFSTDKMDYVVLISDKWAFVKVF